MKCHEIISLLELYREQIAKILNINRHDITMSSEYSFVVIKSAHHQVQFEVNDTSAKLYELHPQDQSVKTKIESATWPGFKTTLAPKVFSEKISQYLEAAETIAATAQNCTTGDDYRPGNFSKIIYTENQIELQQINHMNSRSLDHKKDYSLRSLIFKIDLKNQKEMQIDFNDHSSPNNKPCGEEIKKAIEAYKEAK